jgi:hypothetical protein
MRVTRAAAASVLLAVTLAACSNGPEFALLTRFFAASRLRDLTELKKISTVVFEPATDGIVTSFEILQKTAVPGPDGSLASETISISAPVRQPDGRTVTKKVIVTMQHRAKTDRNQSDGWMITGFSAGPVSPSAPRS